MDQRLGDAQPLHHPARKAADLALGRLLQAYQCQHLLDAAPAQILRQPIGSPHIVQQFHGRHPLVKGGALRQVAEQAARVGVAVGGLGAHDPGASLGGVGQARQQPHGGGLAGAIGAEQADNLSGANFQRNVQYYFFLLVAFCQITGPENCHPNLSRHWIELNYEAESPFPPGRSRRRMACRLPQ